MTPEKQKHNFCIVGFRYDQEHSVGYHKVDTPETVALIVEHLLKVELADCISIRRVYPCQPQPPKQ
jgi:hypothetical protein